MKEMFDQAIKNFNRDCIMPIAERVSGTLLREGLLYCPCGTVSQQITEDKENNGVIIKTKCTCGSLDNETPIKMTDLLGMGE